MATLDMEKDLPSADHVPDMSASDKSDTAPVLELDERGLPLVPQPSDHKDDPLVCPQCSSAFKHPGSRVELSS